MGFDSTKVQFTKEELDAAAALDGVYEALKEKADLATILGQINNIRVVASYVAGGDSKDALADKLFNLAVMFKRDNVKFNTGNAEE
jgi:hypothetical protein